MSQFASATNSAPQNEHLERTLEPTPATAPSAGWLAGCGWLAGWLGGWLVGWLGGGMAGWLAWLAGWRAGSCEEVCVTTTILAPGACGSGVTPRPIKRMQELTPCLTTRIIMCLLCFCRKTKRKKRLSKTPFSFRDGSLINKLVEGSSIIS